MSAHKLKVSLVVVGTNGAPSGEGCVVNGQTAMASSELVRS